MSTKEYLHWSEAGGPNECEHGYAEGIPCPNCDKIPLVIALRAENTRLTQLAFELQDSVAIHRGIAMERRAEIARLRAALERIANDSYRDGHAAEVFADFADSQWRSATVREAEEHEKVLLLTAALEEIAALPNELALTGPNIAREALGLPTEPSYWPAR